MVTIAKTNKYHELVVRHLELLRLYSTISELRLHTNSAIDSGIARFYLNRVINNYPGFFVPALDSMRSYFYIALRSYIGAYYERQTDAVRLTKTDKYSLGKYLNDGSRLTRKKKALKAFEGMVKNNKKELELLKNLRHSVAHFETKVSINSKMIFGDSKTIQILNSLGDVLYLLGYQPGNKPHHFSYDNNYADEVRSLIDELSPSNKEYSDLRSQYLKKRLEWIVR